MGSASTTFKGTFALSGGTFTASSATTTFKGSFTKTGGTFSHNSGVALFDTGFGNVSLTSGGAIFNNVLVTCTAASGAVLILLDSVTVAGDLTITSGTLSIAEGIRSQGSLNPTLTVQGDVYIPSTTGGSINIGDPTASLRFTFNLEGDLNMAENLAVYYSAIVFNGSGDQAIAYTSGTLGAANTWTISKSHNFW